MNSRYRFSVDNENEDGRTDFSNTLEFDATTLDDVLGNFELFLKGSGFVFSGHLTFEQSLEWSTGPDVGLEKIVQPKRSDDSEGGLIE